MKDLNLLSLRRWHYDHPKEYAEFLQSVEKARKGDMAFTYKGLCSLMEMLSLVGVNNMMGLISDLVSGTKGYMKNMMSTSSQSFHCKLDNILSSSLDNEVARQKILNGNPHFNSTLYWLVFDNGFPKAVELISNMLGEDKMPFMQMLGNEAVQSLMHTSFDKTAYTKAQWKNSKNKKAKKVVAATLLDAKGKKGRRETSLLLEEMLRPEYADLLAEEIEKIVTEWKDLNDTDSVFAYIYAALEQDGLLNGKYPYRSYHNVLREKFPHLEIKEGFDHTEALYQALTKTDNFNISITDSQIKYGKKQVGDIGLRFRMLLSPDIIQD